MRYEPGTRYSNSVIYDEATDRVNEFGDTIFVQKREDGTPTGRESVVIGGRIFGLEVAAAVHDRHTRDAAPDLFARLEEILEYCDALKGSDVHKRAKAALVRAMEGRGS